MRAAAASLIAIGLSLAPSASEARPFRVGEIPNGGRLSCETCHETEGGVIFNPFGSDARSALVGDGAASEKSVDWAQLAELMRRTDSVRTLGEYAHLARVAPDHLPLIYAAALFSDSADR